MTNEEYKTREILRFRQELTAIEKNPLQWRKDAREELESDLSTGADRFIRAAGFLCDGSMGYGAIAVLKQLSKRSNRRAFLFTTVAALEFGCPVGAAHAVWREMSDAQKFVVNESLQDLLDKLDAGDIGQLIGLD